MTDHDRITMLTIALSTIARNAIGVVAEDGDSLDAATVRTMQSIAKDAAEKYGEGILGSAYQISVR